MPVFLYLNINVLFEGLEIKNRTSEEKNQLLEFHLKK